MGISTFDRAVVLRATSLKPKLEARGYIPQAKNFSRASRPPIVDVSYTKAVSFTSLSGHSTLGSMV
jgi:hypothetical protein